MRLRVGLASAAFAWATLPVAAAEEADALYARLCLPCHGEAGDGQGPAASLFDPAPRDFTTGVYKLRSTPSGAPPTEGDLVRSIARGMPGTAMPAWEGTLTSDQIAALARKLRSLSPRLQTAAPEHLALPRSPTPGDVGRGRVSYERFGCAGCHGQQGEGDGPSVPTLRDDRDRPIVPYNLRSSPFRAGSGVLDLARSIASGLDGTPMPSYRDALADQELVDLSVYLRSMQPRELLAEPAPGGEVLALRDADAGVLRALPSPRGDGSIGATFWRYPIAAQGVAPPHLAPAEASLDPEQCGRCHAEQYRTWSDSLHARAVGPGFNGQMRGASEQFTYDCHRCHAPMTEQVPFVFDGGVLSPNPRRDAALASAGVTCAGCHLRGWVRHGPEPAEPRRIVVSSYPLRVLDRFERSDFCMPCHQHPMSLAVNGKPPLDTYREWLTGPYFRRGYPCQSCHMPERAHSWKGVHDPVTVAQAMRVDARLTRADGGVTLEVEVANIGAGHMLPSTPTPAIFVHGSLVDRRGAVADSSHVVLDVLQRQIAFRDGEWHEVRDARIAPGDSRRSSHRWATTGAATKVRVEIEVRPDYHYEGVYRTLLRTASGEAASELEAALERATTSSFVTFRRDLTL